MSSERELYPSEKQDRFIVRLPDGMRDRIRAAAEVNNRSMNAEVVATLEEKYPAPAPALEEPLKRLEMILRAMEAHAGALGGKASGADLIRQDLENTPPGDREKVAAVFVEALYEALLGEAK